MPKPIAWIEVRDQAEVKRAGGRLARLYASIEEDGRIDHVLQIHSLRTDTLDGHLRLYRAVMRTPEGLSRRERELIAVAVSACNDCHY